MLFDGAFKVFGEGKKTLYQEKKLEGWQEKPSNRCEDIIDYFLLIL